MLKGPYPVEDVDYYVEPNCPGVYILSKAKDGGTVDYVGRSDTDVSSRIKQSIKEGYGYKYFWFDYATSRRDAYQKECKYYHKYNPPENTNHPPAPSGTYWRCPVIGCPWS